MLYCGIGVFGVGLVGMIVTNLVLSAKSRKLRKLMNETYGDKA